MPLASPRPAVRRPAEAVPAPGSRRPGSTGPISRTATVSASRWVGSATRSCHSALSRARMPPSRSNRIASGRYCGYSSFAASTNTRSYAPSVSRGSTSRARPLIIRVRLGGDPGVTERLLGRALVLGLDVDGGQDAVRGHAGEQVQPADPGAGAHLDHRLGADRRGQESQRGGNPSADRGAAEVGGALSGRGRGLGLGHVQLGVGLAGGHRRSFREGSLRTVPGTARPRGLRRARATSEAAGQPEPQLANVTRTGCQICRIGRCSTSDRPANDEAFRPAPLEGSRAPYPYRRGDPVDHRVRRRRLQFRQFRQSAPAPRRPPHRPVPPARPVARPRAPAAARQPRPARRRSPRVRPPARRPAAVSSPWRWPTTPATSTRR